jgi:tetratricopeptide (TPR) repeat protein
MFEGIMVFNPDGTFTGFFGTIDVQITPWEIFWRAISTRAQRERGQMFIPTEFTGIDIDDSGFIYASNVCSEGEQAVRRLNPTGEDVIRTGENENLGGDLATIGLSRFAGTSNIVDVVYRGKGIYSLLCSLRGRIFTYDREGNLLYIFGGMGSQAGTFIQPVAIEAFGSRIAVLDAQRNEVMLFDETEYGRLINEAVALRFDGDEAQAVEKWREVLKLNENLEIANIGIGKAYLTAGDNESAMRYLRRGQSRTYYSIAYRRYRNEVLKENLPWILTGLVVLIVALPTGLHIRSRVLGKRNDRKGAGV